MSDTVGGLLGVGGNPNGGGWAQRDITATSMPGAGAYEEQGKVIERQDNYGDKWYYPKRWADKGLWIEFDDKAAAAKAHDMSLQEVQSLVAKQGLRVAGAKDVMKAFGSPEGAWMPLRSPSSQGSARATASPPSQSGQSTGLLGSLPFNPAKP